MPFFKSVIPIALLTGDVIKNKNQEEFLMAIMTM